MGRGVSKYAQGAGKIWRRGLTNYTKKVYINLAGASYRGFLCVKRITRTDRGMVTLAFWGMIRLTHWERKFMVYGEH